MILIIIIKNGEVYDMTNNQDEIISLVNMKKDQEGVVREISGGNRLNQKLISLGVIPGQKIKKANSLLMHGPVIITTQTNVEVALGYGVSRKIWVEVHE